MRYRHSTPCAVASDTSAVLSRQPDNVADLFELSQALFNLEASPLALAQLTDAIMETDGTSNDSLLASAAEQLKRQRRKQLLTDLLKADRNAYVETVSSFLRIPRTELPNRQDVPARAFDAVDSQSGAAEPLGVVPSAAAGLTSDGLVPDCALPDKAMGENALEALLLDVTRGIYSEQTGTSRSQEGGIKGLIDEMRRFMLTETGSSPEVQREKLIRTLRVLMTPYLPPFYRIFMAGIVPKYDENDARVGADPKWLADGVQCASLPKIERQNPRLPIDRSLLTPDALVWHIRTWPQGSAPSSRPPPRSTLSQAGSLGPGSTHRRSPQW